MRPTLKIKPSTKMMTISKMKITLKMEQDYKNPNTVAIGGHHNPPIDPVTQCPDVPMEGRTNDTHT